ncbi:hypothetical protein CDD81_1634 [Ophiocordyceps australis]|uniref:Beta-glucosidase cel3A n=1 Tax=Ophiocordyceps australis TaxID=1399860 RepID=A0A2C5X7Z9_9HYPO|nr:hypothetical protein CDD81_1634 [Ophiocordyceps australis]
MGAEYRKKGVNVQLGPVIGPLGRLVRGGRNWEGFSPDAYLAGVLGGASVEGIQSQGVQACVKHFIANEQETYRIASEENWSVSSNLDDATMHEAYLWPFSNVVKAGASTIMCSYQRINNSFACSNSKVLNGLLKSELGFQGFVVTDWSAAFAGVAAAPAGLDMAMPDGTQIMRGQSWGPFLVEAVRNGSVAEARIDDMVTRILTPWFHLNQDSIFPHPGFGKLSSVTTPHPRIDARDPLSRPILFQGAVEGHVLVKNTKSTLPLTSPRLLSLYGYSAKSPDFFGPLTGFEAKGWLYGTEPINFAEFYANVFTLSKNYTRSPIGLNGTMIGAGGSGSVTPAVFTSPFESLKARAARDDVAIFYDFVSAEPAVDPVSDACIVFGNAWSSEGYDRPGLSDEYTDSLILAVASQCEKTIVVLHNAGIRLADPFITHPNVTAVIYAHLPGRDSGDALVSILYGESNPSGKLPYTIAKTSSDYGTLLNPDDANVEFPQSDFVEGIYLDYKHFEKHNITPRFEFGFGLGYTSFSMSDLDIQSHGPLSAYPVGAVVSGGQADLWDAVARVTLKVGNSGPVAGAEVVQLYVYMPGEPAKQLRGFEKVMLQPGEVQSVSMELMRRDLSRWDTGAQKWRLDCGSFGVLVGNSSLNLPLQGSVEVWRDEC